ncbi:MAG: halocarboxylic acid dehydrogenase DehI family protein [Burkholderiales bacterium]
MNREYPEPLPRIHPLPEYLATGKRKQWYEEMREAMQVPWMGVVTMAYAHYPNFFEALWKGAQPLVRSRPFVEASEALRQFTETEAAKLRPPPITMRLENLGYAAREIEQIRGMIEIFSHGNFPYLLLATIVRMLLEGGEMGEGIDALPFEGRHAPDVSVPLVLMEIHHADAPTRALYDDVKRTLGLPFVNTDYRALARWPSYFSLAWGDLGSAVRTPAYNTICNAIHERAVELAAHGLPNPGRLSSAALRTAAGRDASAEEVLQVSRLFQWLLPGLVTNVAYLRAQLKA